MTTHLQNCNSSYKFEIWKHGFKDYNVDIKPSFTTTVRSITPNNRLVGAVVLSQKRVAYGRCSQENSLFKTARLNKHVNAYAGAELNKCHLAAQTSDLPFGYDPAFIRASSMYNGKLRAQTLYKGSEFATSELPYAFFPHKYNADAIDRDRDGVVNQTEASASASSYAHSYVSNGKVLPAKAPEQTCDASADDFLLFFDERLTQTQALKMLTFAKDGKFIDAQTEEVKVRFVTYNVVSYVMM